MKEHNSLGDGQNHVLSIIFCQSTSKKE